MRRHVSAPYGQPPLCRRVGIALIPSDRCGGMFRHPTGSRHFAAELALRSSLATGAAACVGTLRAAAALPPSWIGALPKRQVRRQLSAPFGQPPISRRVGFASGSLAPCLHSATLHFARSLRSNMFSCCSFVALILSRAIYVYLGLWVSLRLICFSSFVGFVPSCAHNNRTCFVLAPRPCSAVFCSYVSL